MTNETQFFRKIYLSHFIRNGTKGLRKGYCVRGELKTEHNCNILTPSSSGYSSTSFSSCGAAQPGALRAQFSAGSGSHSFELQQLTPNSDLQLTRTSCSTGLYNCFRPPASVSVASALNSTRPQSSLSPDIIDRIHLLFTQVHFLFDSSAGSEVNMLQINRTNPAFLEQQHYKAPAPPTLDNTPMLPVQQTRSDRKVIFPNNIRKFLIDTINYLGEDPWR